MRLSYCLVFCIGLMLACQPVTKPEQTTAIAHTKVDTVLMLSQSDSLFKLGEYYNSINKNDNAVYFHEEALRIKKEFNADSSLFKNYETLGNLYRKLYNIRVADEYFEKAKSLVELNPKISSITKVNLFLSLAYCKRELINYGEARANTSKAQLIVEQEFPNDHYQMGRIINTFGNLYYVEKQYVLAIKYYEEAIHLFKRVDRFGEIGSALLNIGIIYSNLKEYRSSLRYLDESIRYVKLVNDEESESVAAKLLNKAGVLQDLGHYDSAEHYYRKGLATRIKLFGEKSIYTFGARAPLAQFYFRQGNLDSAAYYFHRSINSLVRNFNSPSLTEIPHPENLDISKDLAWALSEKAKVLAALYSTSSDTNLLASSISYLRLADSVLSVYRRHLSYEDQQFALMQSEETDYQRGLQIPYEVGIDCALKLYESTGEDKYVADVIYFLENSRARRLSEALSQSTPIIQKQNELYRKRAELLHSYQTGNSDSLDQSLTHISEQINLINKRFAETNPDYLFTKYELNLPDINELKSLASKQNATLLEYYWSKESLYLLAINHKEIALKRIDVTKELIDAIDQILASLDNKEGDYTSKEEYRRFVKNAHYLYTTLIPGTVTSKTDKLIISPHGQLSFLPFELLIEALPDTIEVNYHLPYLLYKYSISYTQAFRLLMNGSSNQNSGSKLLAIGFSTKTVGAVGLSRNALQGLPGTEEEIKSIQAVMKNHLNVYLLGEDASESALKKNIADYNIVHLAVHGESDPLNDLNSKLLFRNETDTLNDGFLYAHELYDLDLKKTRLVVLSACESGIGKLQPGEGFLSIARGFMYAGCPSQVISLWKIDDRTTAKVMGNFYKYVSNEMNFDVSLTRAKIDYLSGVNEFNSHPSYWAAFLQVGDSQGIKKSAINWKWIALLISLLGLAFGVYFVIRRNEITHSRTS